MQDIRFSVVIPTRERAETLKYTLKTCLEQNFDNYEIIVSDNCSSPETRKVVNSFESEKIKYFRSDEPLAMSKSWEFALSHASGEYIIIIGDDDGLLLNSLPEIDRLIKELGMKSLSWKTIQYDWPNTPTPYANKIRIPWGHEIQIVNATESIQKRANLYQLAPRLPMLYHSAIHRDVINLLRQKTGCVFRAGSPDMYSGFALAYLLQTYPVIDVPMSISAVSPTSTGVSHFYVKRSKIAQEFDIMNVKAGLGYHPQVPNIPVIGAAIADSFLHAKDALFPDESKFFIDRKRLVNNCIRDLNYGSEEEWKEYMQIIRKSLSDDVELQRWFDSKFLNHSYISKSNHKQHNTIFSKILKKYPFSAIRNILLECAKEFAGFYTLDGRELGVTDVYGVAKIYTKIKSNEVNKFEFSRKGMIYAWRKLGNKMLPFGRILLDKNLVGRINL